MHPMDASGFVGPDLVKLYDLFHGGLAIHHIVLVFLRDKRERYPRGILDGRLVLLVREVHFLHTERTLFRTGNYNI